MPLPNRVTPLGELIAVPDRGLVYGNRGCLHDERGRIRRGHAGKRWIACRLRFRGWRRSPLLQPGRFTELFFLDEATAMAAGHRRPHSGDSARQTSTARTTMHDKCCRSAFCSFWPSVMNGHQTIRGNGSFQT